MSLKSYSWLTETQMSPQTESIFGCLLHGLVGACGVSVLYSLMRLRLHLHATSITPEGHSENSSSTGIKAVRRLFGAFHFWSLAVILSVVGQRVACLVVLEFSLRTFLAFISGGLEPSSGSVPLLLVQSQFSLGCALSCSLHFLLEGALHQTLNLLLVAGLSWMLASQSQRLCWHVLQISPQHNSEQCCGVGLTLCQLNSALVPFTRRMVYLVFAVGTVASFGMVCQLFLFTREPQISWTPLIICYAMLVVVMQEGQERKTGRQLVLHTVMLRLGVLLVLTLASGSLLDVMHVLMALLGELVCLLPCQDLLPSRPQREEERS